jgi:GntR family transcriptional regulator
VVPHVRIADAIRADVYSGVLVPGQRLPDAVELAAQYDVPLKLVKDAIRLLIDEGVLIARRPQGTYVRTVQATTVSALRRLLAEADGLLTDLERRSRPEQRMAIAAWRARARAAGATSDGRAGSTTGSIRES